MEQPIPTGEAGSPSGLTLACFLQGQPGSHRSRPGSLQALLAAAEMCFESEPLNKTGSTPPAFQMTIPGEVNSYCQQGQF